MSGGSSDPLRALICGGSPGKFAQPTEGWQACSNDDILAAAAGATTLQGPGRKPGQLGWEEAQGEQQGIDIDRPGCLPLGE